VGWKIFDETVNMMQKRYRYFPREFRWRGQRYRVESVERCWSVSRRGWKRRIERHFFHVRCAAGDFELFQDVQTGNWHLRRARLASRPVTAIPVVLSASR
jgi:hypothetical protein